MNRVPIGIVINKIGSSVSGYPGTHSHVLAERPRRACWACVPNICKPAKANLIRSAISILNKKNIIRINRVLMVAELGRLYDGV